MRPLRSLSRSEGWLGTPPGGSLVPCDSDNPFLRYRCGLWSYHLALESGMTDEGFCAAVEALDSRVAEVNGRGFMVTPAFENSALGAELGVEVWVKDETGNVTGTHKARHLMGLALHLAVKGAPAAQRLAISSCGNAALAAAAVANAAGRPLDVFVPTWAESGVVDALRRLGARVEVCRRRQGALGDPCNARFRNAVANGALPFCAVAAENVWAIDGGRLLAFELIEALESGDGLGAVFVQVGGGALASSVIQGFAEAAAAGIIDRTPALFAVQTEGCAPLAAAWRRLGEKAGNIGIDAALQRASERPGDFMKPWAFEGDGPASAATGILDDVTYDWLPLVWAMTVFGGRPVVVQESAVLEANALARRETGIAADPTGTAGLAGLMVARSAGLVDDGDRVGVIFTGVDRSQA